MAERSYARLALSGFLIVFIFNILAAGVGYAIRLFLARQLTEAEYGLYFSVTTFVALVIFFRNMGLSETYVKFIPESIVRKRAAFAHQLVRFVLAFSIVSSIVLGAIVFSLSGWLATNYFRSEAAGLVIGIVLVSSVVTAFSSTARSLFQSYNKHLLFAGQYLAENAIVFLLLVGGFFFVAPSAAATAGAYLATYIIISALFFPIAARLTRHTQRIRSRLPFKRLFRYGFYVMLGSLGSVVILYTDTLILTGYRTLAEVGIYNAVVPTVMLLNFFGTSISQVFTPIAAELWARRARKRLSEGLSFIFTHALMILLPAVILLAVFSRHFLSLLFGESYAAGAAALSILSVATFFIAFYTIAASTLAALGKPKEASTALLLGAALNLVLNFLLIPRMGIDGAAVSSLVSYFLAFLLAFRSLHRHVPLRSSARTLGFILVGGLLFLALLFGIRFLGLGSLWPIALMLFLAGLVYVAFLWLVGVLRPRFLFAMFRS